ncbi:zinc ribbon domain-containing protein [bacterium]|nr:zinc ribbon domain-containing protein [candidate division CSSED10-310 bacterium]
MPIYEYHCEHCGRKFEKLQGFSASQTCECPNCGQSAQRLISLASFVLKGTGWYVTDHPSKDRKRGMNSTKAPEPASETVAKSDASQKS